MIHINELRITEDSNYLIVDVAIDSDSYFTDVYLDTIKIDTQDTFVSSGPSSTPVYTYTLTSGVNSKNVRLTLDASSLGVNLSNNLFFVWVTSRGSASSTAPSSVLTNPIIDATASFYPIYQKAINFSKKVSAHENIDRGFVNFILQLNMLQYAIKTGHYPEAIIYWNNFFKITT